MARILPRKSTPCPYSMGNNESIFPADGAHPYKRDLKKIDFHLLDTGHFALEEDHELIAELISSFFKRIKSTQA
jgi:pimeloyl-ACP methyl ester carboxylesterase